MRARIDVSEIEAQTKIRAKYLRALENEEWDLLPGPTFVRSFLRTYAQALGLDAKALLDEYRLHYEQPSEIEHQPVVSSTPRSRSRQRPGRSAPPAPSRGYMIALGTVALVIVLLIYGLLSSKGNNSPSTPASTGTNTAQTRGHGASHARVPATAHRPPAGSIVELSLEPSAPVYVCLIDAAGRKRIPGVIIQPPYTPLKYHSTRFEITLGNSSVTMYIDGKALTVPPSSRPTGYSITSAGRHTLEPSRQPTCT
jgi:cytoskeleton protein RodZ